MMPLTSPPVVQDIATPSVSFRNLKKPLTSPSTARVRRKENEDLRHQPLRAATGPVVADHPGCEQRLQTDHYSHRQLQ